MFISLDPSCSVKYQIDSYLHKKNLSQRTNFFDWLISDNNSINFLLECKNINNLININSIKKIGIKKNNSNDIKDIKSKILFEKIGRLISIHDLNEKYNSLELTDFIKKYIRRYERLINTIKMENIIFIRRQYVSKKFVSRFFKNLNIINPKNNSSLVVLYSFSEFNKKILKKKYNVEYFNLNKFIEINLDFYIINKNDDSWTDSKFNWIKIFDTINSIEFDTINSIEFEN